MSVYDDAVAALYRAPFGSFVTERKRLAAELKAAGHKAEAAELGKLPRPPVSAWAVNQLWWLERSDFDALMAAAARVKVGDRDASRAHREALGKLREHSSRILREAGNAASEATLRRVSTTLSAIAAAGTFDPDPPGALAADRDPPGFEALGFGVAAVPAPAPATAAGGERRTAEAESRTAEAERRAAEAKEQRRRQAERERLAAELRESRALHSEQQRELSRLRSEVERTEQGLRETQARLEELEKELTNL